MNDTRKMIAAFALTWAALSGVLGYVIWDKKHTQTKQAQQAGLTAQDVDQLIKAQMVPIVQQYDQQFQQILTHDGEIVDALNALEKAINTGNHGWALAQVQHYIEQAVIEADLMKNPELAAQLLGLADIQLQRMNNPNYLPLRQAIAKDKQMLVSGLSVRRENVILALNAVVATLPEIQQRTAILAPVEPSAAAPAQPKTWKEHVISSLAELKSLVVVRHHAEGIEPYFSPNEAAVVSENIQLILLQAAYAASAGNQALFENHLQMAIAWFNRYYDIHSPMGEKMLVTLDNIKKQTIAVPAPLKFATPEAWNTLFKGAAS